MKRAICIIIMLAIMFSFSACGEPSRGSMPATDGELVIENQVLHSPRDSEAYLGMVYSQAEGLLREAGFEWVELHAIDDIDSSSGIVDGSIESITIAGMSKFTTGTEFDVDAKAIINYHNIPKIKAPLSSGSAETIPYMDVGKAFFDAGFSLIETDEVYDLPADASAKTALFANGKLVEDDGLLPFDSSISSIGHYPVPAYATTINIDFEGNWLFSKYDVIVSLNGEELETLPHGQDAVYELALTAGKYELKFTSAKDTSVFGNIEFTIDSETTASYHVSCLSKSVDVKETEFVQALSEGNIMIPFSSNHYLRKDYETVVSELEDLGFTNVGSEATPDNLWAPSGVNSVVDISIDNVSNFNRDHVFEKDAQVVVRYHLPDFTFEQSLVRVTEKDTFDLAYKLTSGDDLSIFEFEISDPDILRRNDDGSFTALQPGTACLTVSGEGYTYSTCEIEVAEIIVPLEKINFAHDEMEVVVGSTFSLDYTMSPENANKRDYTMEISNSQIEQTGENAYYSTEEGDTSISFYQDDRLLGTCLIHSVAVNIEELFLEDGLEELFIGDTESISFSLAPARATNKGIVVTSSRPDIAEASFDERGDSVVSVTGISAGTSTITITAPNGAQVVQEIAVNEVEPVAVKVTNAKPSQRIEVGSPIELEIVWDPINTSAKELKWTSSDRKIVKVNEDGSLEAVGVGTADITATHKSGISYTFTLAVEPTLVRYINMTDDYDTSKKLVPGDKFNITASVGPENATDHTIIFSSSDENIAKVSEKGVVTAVGEGTCKITAKSPDGPSKSINVNVSPAPQKFKISWSASLAGNDHVGGNWSCSFSVNGEDFYSGNTILLEPDASLRFYFYVQESDDRPDTGSYGEEIKYSADLCREGYTVTKRVSVKENGGRYSGHYAYWDFTVTITPVK